MTFHLSRSVLLADANDRKGEPGSAGKGLRRASDLSFGQEPSHAPMSLKSTLIAFAMFFSFASEGHAVGFRFIDDFERLKTLGFHITASKQPDDLVLIAIKPPEKFEVDKEVGSKPFMSLTLREVLKRPPDRIALLTTPQSSFPLECTKNAEGKLETKIDVFSEKSENLFLVFTFMHDAEGQWPILVYVPISAIIAHLKKEP